MKIWVDAQLSPFIALFINENFADIKAVSVRSLGMTTASNYDIFKAGRREQIVIMSKDADFVKLIELHDVPPQLIWIACGNTSNSQMGQILKANLSKAKSLLEQGEKIVEISN